MRFDGHRSLVFKELPNDSTAISSSIAEGMLADDYGYLWFATKQHGLNRFDPVNQTFQQFHPSAAIESSILSEKITSISKGRQGVIWIGFSEGFTALDSRSGLFTHFTKAKFPVLEGSTISHMLESASGDLYLVDENRGLLRMRPGGQPEVFASQEKGNLPIDPNDVREIYIDSDGNLFVGTGQAGVFIVSAERAVPFMEELELRGVHDVLEDSRGDYWLATADGVVVTSPSTGQWRMFGEESGLSHYRALSLYESSEGAVWIGTFHGVTIAYSSQFSLIDNQRLPAGNVLALADASGTNWIGTDRGLFAQPTSTLAYSNLNEFSNLLPDGAVALSLVEHKGLIYVGTFALGLYIFNSEGVLQEHITENSVENPDGISSSSVSKTAVDVEGGLWVATIDAGLNYRPPGATSFRTYRYDPLDSSSLNSDLVYTVFVEQAGIVWIGTDRGLARYNADVGTFTRIMYQPGNDRSLPGQVVYTITEDQDARLWIGLENAGVAVWEAHHRKASEPVFTRLLNNINLPSATVCSLQEGSEGDMWIATGSGLTRIAFDTLKYRHFAEAHGLQSRDFNLGAATRDDFGQLYFGGPKGINSFDPRAFDKEEAPRTVRLTKVTVVQEPVWFDVPLNEVTEVNLSYDDPLMEIEFSAMEYVNPGSIRYKYQLVGVDQAWQQIGNKSDLMFPGLAPGRYTLRLAVDGPRLDAPVTDIGIYKRPPPLGHACRIHLICGAVHHGRGSSLCSRQNPRKRGH